MAASAKKNSGAATWNGYRPVSNTPRMPKPANTDTATDKIPVSAATRRSAPNDRAHAATAKGITTNDNSTAILMAPAVESWPKETSADRRDDDGEPGRVDQERVVTDREVGRPPVEMAVRQNIADRPIGTSDDGRRIGAGDEARPPHAPDHPGAHESAQAGCQPVEPRGTP